MECVLYGMTNKMEITSIIMKELIETDGLLGQGYLFPYRHSDLVRRGVSKGTAVGIIQVFTSKETDIKQDVLNYYITDKQKGLSISSGYNIVRKRKLSIENNSNKIDITNNDDLDSKIRRIEDEFKNKVYACVPKGWRKCSKCKHSWIEDKYYVPNFCPECGLKYEKVEDMIEV